MFIECSGHQFALYLWSFLILFVYRCKREYYLSEFKVVFIIYGELIVSESKCIAGNLMRHLSHGDCSYSLCIGAKNVIQTLWRTIWFQTSLTSSALFAVVLSFELFFNSCWNNVFISVCSLIHCPPNDPVYKNIGSKHIQELKQNMSYE